MNHGYKVHTEFEEKFKRNFSTLSYLNLSYDEIKIDIERAHKSILKKSVIKYQEFFEHLILENIQKTVKII